MQQHHSVNVPRVYSSIHKSKIDFESQIFSHNVLICTFEIFHRALLFAIFLKIDSKNIFKEKKLFPFNLTFSLIKKYFNNFMYTHINNQLKI